MCLSLVREIKMMAAKLILSYCHRWNHDNRSNETIGYGCRNNMTNPSSRNASCALNLISTFSLYRYTNDVKYTSDSSNYFIIFFFIRDRLQLPFTNYAQYTSDMILQKNTFYQLTLFFM